MYANIDLSKKEKKKKKRGLGYYNYYILGDFCYWVRGWSVGTEENITEERNREKLLQTMVLNCLNFFSHRMLFSSLSLSLFFLSHCHSFPRTFLSSSFSHSFFPNLRTKQITLTNHTNGRMCDQAKGFLGRQPCQSQTRTRT